MFGEGATTSSQALQKLAQGKWTLVLVNMAVTGITGALFVTAKELAMPSEAEAAKARVRILFLVPENVAAQATPLLEEEHLPYVLKPFTFHDLLERVSDLLMETEAIGSPLRKVRQEGLKSSGKSRRAGPDPGLDGARNTAIFSIHENHHCNDENPAPYQRPVTNTSDT